MKRKVLSLKHISHLLVALLLAQATFVLAQSGQKEVHVGIPGAIVTFDPANYRNRNTETVLRNVFDSLFTYTPDGRLVPEIAESAEQIDDLIWEFKIRQGITFHNGDPLTAEDVVFSYARVIVEGAMEGETSPRKGLMLNYKSVEAVDDYTVRFELVAPNLPQLVIGGTVNMLVMPKNYFEEVGIDGFLAAPVGAGPFKFVEANYAERIVLQKYDGYWGGSPDLVGLQGPAPIDMLIFEVVPDPAARLAALRAGDLDIIQGVLPDQIPAIQNNPNLAVKSGVGTNWIFFGFNTELAPLDVPQVRQAIAHAIDYDLLVDAAFGGLALPLYGLPFSSASLVQDPNLEPYTYDPELAKQLLTSAGNPNIQLTIDTIGNYLLVAEAVAGMLQDVGIDAQVRTWELAALLEAFQSGSRQAAVTGWGNAGGSPEWPRWPVDEGTGYSIWNSNQAFWDLMGQATTFPDIDERVDMYREALGMVAADLPYVSLLVPDTVEATSARVVNFQPDPRGRVNMHRVDLTVP